MAIDGVACSFARVQLFIELKLQKNFTSKLLEGIIFNIRPKQVICPNGARSMAASFSLPRLSQNSNPTT